MSTETHPGHELELDSISQPQDRLQVGLVRAFGGFRTGLELFGGPFTMGAWAKDKFLVADDAVLIFFSPFSCFNLAVTIVPLFRRAWV